MSTVNADQLHAFQMMMQEFGISPEDLLADPSTRRLPTVSAAVDAVRNVNTYTASTRRTWETGWSRFEDMYGERNLADITTEDIRRLLVEAQEDAERRRRVRQARLAAKGRHLPPDAANGAQINALHAIRAVFTRAYDAANITQQSPAHRVPMPDRIPNRRRGLSDDELGQLFDVAQTTGNDVLLDTLLLRTAFETGARQEGLINLRLGDLRPDRQTIWLDEKRGKRREQPITAEALAALRDFAAERGASAPADEVFNYRPGTDGRRRPLTSRRFDTLFERIRRRLAWADADGVSLHFLRHTAAQRIERSSSDAVAGAFLGHEPRRKTPTSTYTTALKAEVFRVWSIAYDSPHPLAKQ